MQVHAAALNASIGDAPLLAVLARSRECEDILARNNVGRIAFALQDRVSIIPVNYVYADGCIYGRTAAGGKLREILRNRRIAFEVDEHTQLFEWRSVVVRGPLYLLDPSTDPSEERIYSKAVRTIQRLASSALTEFDPTFCRDQLFIIRVVQISSRSSQPAGGKQSSRERSSRPITAKPTWTAEVNTDLSEE